MPTMLHEALIEMFRHRAALAAELLTGALGMTVPSHGEARVDSGDLADVKPTEYRADAVVVLTGGGDPCWRSWWRCRWAKIATSGSPGPYTWPRLRARLRCPTVLLVVCVDEAVAAWCAGPIELGHPDWRLIPLVVGPDRVPLAVLEARGIEVDEDARARIVGCSDLDRIESWLRRAVTADSAHDLLD